MYGYTQQNGANQFGTFNSSYGLTSATQNQPTMNSFGQATLGSLGASGMGSNAGGYSARDFGAAAGTQFPYSNVSSGYNQYGSQQASAAAGYGPQPSLDTYTNQNDYGAAFKAATSNASANSYLGLNRISGMGASGYGSGLGATNALGSKPQTAAPGGQYGISNYEALFAAANAAVASNYMNHSQPKPITAVSQWSGPKKFGGMSGQSGGTFPQKRRFGQGHSTQPMAQFYCEVCKISCAGQQTYDEHLQGQKHKKKAAIEKGENQQSLPRSKVSFKCDVCNVTCTGRDTYEAHVKGTKHQKTTSLLRKLGKPIPAMEPTLIPPLDALSGAPIPTVGGDAVPVKAAGTDKSDTSSIVEKALLEEENIEIVGEEYIEEERDAAGKFIQYNCKLCDCKFSDPNAKAIHLKGRRHRLQFKNKVDPKFRVEVKSNNPRKRRDLMQQEMEYMGHSMFGQMMPPSDFLAPVTATPHCYRTPYERAMDDRHVQECHRQIQPSVEQLQKAERLMALVEKTLKAVSDHYAEKAEEDQHKNDEVDGEQATPPERLLKGVMRVGFYSKQLLLASDKHIDAVVICSKIPTVTLLKEVAELFNKLVEKSDDETVSVEENPEKSALVVSLSGIDVTCNVTLTSPVLREGESAPAGEAGAAPPTDVEKPADALPVEPCLKALAELRHAKWYQVKCVPLQIVTPTLRVLRDVQSRVTKWSSMSSWAMELFVEKVLASVGRLISPGDSIRRVFEALASGYLIDRGNQLVDPCEKDVVDALGNLSIQDREDITASAQHAVRLMSFNQIYKVLGTERELAELPVPQNGDRKRHRDATSLDDDAKKEKKDSAGSPEKAASPTNTAVKAEEQ